MSANAHKCATYEDLQRLPANMIGELLCGELHTQPRPSSVHAFAASGLGMDLGAAFQRGRGGPGGWFIIDEPELHLGPEPDVVVPDLAGWRVERMPVFPDVPYFELSPDWVCEVVSPSTAGRDRTIKLEIYRRENVGHYWIVDPVARTLEVLRLDGESYRIVSTYAGAAAVRAEPFEAVELELASLWPQTQAKTDRA